MNDRVVVLGAELQPAVSMAVSRPDLQFLFVSERDVVDGWGLANVEIKKSSIEEFAAYSQLAHIVALSPRWLRCLKREVDRYALSRVLNRLANKFPEWTLPTSSVPLREDWVLKGDLFHRPDAVLQGAGGENAEQIDSYGCTNVYQRHIANAVTTLAMGRRTDGKNCALGVVRIHSEAFAREDFLMAGESIESDEIERRSRSILEVLDYSGFFSMNWVTDASGQIWLTSFRPVPRALFQLFRVGGVDLLEEPKGRAKVNAGHRFIVDYHYESYR